MRSIPKLKYEKQLKKRPKLTCVIGVKCSDGVVLVADKKISSYDQPTEYTEKIHMDYYPIVTSAAGGADRYNEFRKKLLPALQPESVWTNFEVSGVIQMYTSKNDSFSSYQQRMIRIVRETNGEQRPDDQIELLVATQVVGSGALLTHINTDGYPSDVFKYKAIGTGGQYSYVFLRPFYNQDIKMEEFARLGYFIVKYIDNFELDGNSGLDKNASVHSRPQLWFIPNSGQLYRGEERQDIINKFEFDTNKMIDNFRQKGIDKLL